MAIAKPGGIQSVPSLNYTPGRGPCSAPVAIVLHAASGAVAALDDQACRPMDDPARSHASFHYGVDGCDIHEYVNPNDTAQAFGTTETPPALPAGCVGGTADQATINIAINPLWLATFAAQCPANQIAIPECLCALVGWLASTYGITPSATTILKADSALKYLSVGDLVTCAADYIAHPPIAPTQNCAPTGDTSKPFEVVVCQNGTHKVIPSSAISGAAITYSGGVFYANGVPVVTGILLTDINGIPQGYLLPLNP